MDLFVFFFLTYDNQHIIIIIIIIVEVLVFSFTCSLELVPIPFWFLHPIHDIIVSESSVSRYFKTMRELIGSHEAILPDLVNPTFITTVLDYHSPSATKYVCP
jgi:hypothetical protein